MQLQAMVVRCPCSQSGQSGPGTWWPLRALRAGKGPGSSAIWNSMVTCDPGRHRACVLTLTHDLQDTQCWLIPDELRGGRQPALRT